MINDGVEKYETENEVEAGGSGSGNVETLALNNFSTKVFLTLIYYLNPLIGLLQLFLDNLDDAMDSVTMNLDFEAIPKL